MQPQSISIDEEKLIATQVKLNILNTEYNTLIVSFFAHFFIAFSLAIILSDKISFQRLYGWIIALCIADLFAFIALKTFRSTPSSIIDFQYWQKIYLIINVFVAGICGAAGIILMPENNLIYQFFIIVVIFAFSAAFAQGTIIDIIICRLDIILILFPLIIWCSLQTLFLYKAIILVLLIYMSFLLAMTTKFNKVLKEALVLRYKNTLLNEKMFATNITLEQKVIERTHELKIAKEQAESSKEDAEAANRAKTEFLGIVSHELRTPLRVIGSGANGLQKHFLKLIETYQLAKSAKLPVPYITPQQFELIPSLLDGIEKETDAAFNFIKMLLSNLGKMGDAQDSLHVSMNHCIETALLRYPFAEGEKKKIIWHKNHDFNFMGNEVLMVHVLFNLLKNALQYIEEAGKGEIDIWLESTLNSHILHFKDTAKGVPADILPHILDRYYSKSQGGTGIGLAFCRMIVTSFGGTISCESIENSHTEFLLMWPVA